MPGAVLGTFSKLIGFRRRNTVPGSDDIIAVLFEGLPFAPDTEALLRPAPDYASLTSFLIPTSQNEAGIDAPNLPSIPLQGPRHYPWTRATSASLSGVVTYLFYDRNSDENAPPIAPPYAGMHVMFRKENNPVECSTAIQITEVGNQVIGLSDLRKFKGWIGRAETSVLLSRVEEDGFIGTILEAHPGTLPNGKPCISGLVTFRINRGGRSLSS